ncbi:MAG: hypothetical protein IMW89_12830 [Ktedonobacteraceae bacterium]|nr:hypothetical protein [Ktedonobacteraceae bacterium]
MNQTLEAILATWLKEPQASAQRLIQYYGEPDEFSPSQLTWYNTKDGWKRSVLRNEEIPHNFPAPHNDFLEQFIDYHVPLEKYTDLARFDGSVIVERTKGEISARCGGTSMNFVAINLAHDIVTGKRTVEEARAEYARLYQAFQRGEKPPYTQAFQFAVPRGNTGDLDAVLLK